MEIRGRIVVIALFVVGIGMSVAAWRHNYRQTDQAAKFWGRERAVLLLKSPQLELLRVARIEPVSDNSAETPQDVAETTADATIGGWQVVRSTDLSDAPGLLHFRHALTYDDNYAWQPRSLKPQQFDAAYALRFADGGNQLVLLFSSDFSEMGRLEHAGDRLTVLPCARMSTALRSYLRDVGSLDPSDAP